MAPAFSKEAILQGSIDHLCLACESYLRSERDVCLHVATAAHRRNVDGTDYVDKYRHDRIRKVKKWYYCEFCNVLVSTLTAVGLHVKESNHMAIKSQMIARVDDVIVTENTVIPEEAWHGFIDDNTCIICDVEYEHQDVHKSEPTHVINLIQSKVTDNCYRMIDESTFHCMTCNEVAADITSHLDDDKHVQVLLVKLEKNKSNKKVTQTQDKDQKPKSVNYNKESSDILDSIPKYQKDHININFESRTAVCRKCSMHLEFSRNDIEKHIEEHKNIKNTKTKTNSNKCVKDTKKITIDSGSSTASPVSKIPGKKNEEANKSTMEKKVQKKYQESVQKMTAEHGLTYIDNNKVFCPLCNKTIPAAVKNITEHVNGETHKSRIPTNKIKNCNFARVPLVLFMREAILIENLLHDDDVVVNNKYCIDISSFFYFTKISPGRYRCQVCEVNLRSHELNNHKSGEKHDRAFHGIPVLIRSDSEFIREIRVGVFQCGYCNIYDSWGGMEDHLKSIEHTLKKDFASWRLSQHEPGINRLNGVKNVHEAFIRFLLS